MKVSTGFLKLPEITSVLHHTEHSECFKMTEWKAATLSGAHCGSLCGLSSFFIFIFGLNFFCCFRKNGNIYRLDFFHCR